jgi:hypothetical protein
MINNDSTHPITDTKQPELKNRKPDVNYTEFMEALQIPLPPSTQKISSPWPRQSLLIKPWVKQKTRFF